MVTPIQVLEGGEYRIAQTAHGAPFVQFLDEKTSTWVAVRKSPQRIGDVEELLAKYAAKAKVAEAFVAKAKRELAGYKDGFASRGREISALKETQRHLTELAGE